MLYHLSIHRPRPEHEQDLIASMHRFGATAREQGAIEAHTLKDARSEALVGLAIWRSDDDLAAARPALGRRSRPTTSTLGSPLRPSCSCSTTCERGPASTALLVRQIMPLRKGDPWSARSWVEKTISR